MKNDIEEKIYIIPPYSLRFTKTSYLNKMYINKYDKNKVFFLQDLKESTILKDEKMSPKNDNGKIFMVCIIGNLTLSLYSSKK